MNYQEAIAHTKNKGGMKQSLPGFLLNIAAKLKDKYGDDADCFVMGEISQHFEQARKAWLEDDLETVAEFFGLYVD